MVSATKITVYMPSKNYGRFLEKSIQSVIRQTYKNWELFVVDDNSSDNTSEIGEFYAASLPEKIHFVRHESSLGLQRVANDVLSRCTGKYIIRVDGDDWLDESALHILLCKIEEQDDTAIAYGNFLYVDANGDIIGCEQKVNEQTNWIPSHGACSLIRTQYLKNVGGYDEELNAQDGWDIWQKLANRYKIGYTSSYIFFYRQHSNSLSKNHRRLLFARRKIYEKSLFYSETDFKPRCLVVIGAKSKYDKVSNTPAIHYRGVSLLENAIRSVSRSDIVSDIFVSTDDEDVVAFANSLRDMSGFPPATTYIRGFTSEVGRLPLKDILTEAIEKCEQFKGYRPDITIFLSMFAVNRTEAHVKDAVNALRATSSDTVVTVNELKIPIFSIQPEGLKPVNSGKLRGMNFETEQLYAFNGVALGAWSEVILEDRLFEGKICYSEMEDIDGLQIDAANIFNISE